MWKSEGKKLKAHLLKAHPLCLVAPCFCVHLSLWYSDGLLNNCKDISWGHLQVSPGLSPAQLFLVQSMRHFSQPMMLSICSQFSFLLFVLTFWGSPCKFLLFSIHPKYSYGRSNYHRAEFSSSSVYTSSAHSGSNVSRATKSSPEFGNSKLIMLALQMLVTDATSLLQSYHPWPTLPRANIEHHSPCCSHSLTSRLIHMQSSKTPNSICFQNQPDLSFLNPNREAQALAVLFPQWWELQPSLSVNPFLSSLTRLQCFICRLYQGITFTRSVKIMSENSFITASVFYFPSFYHTGLWRDCKLPFLLFIFYFICLIASVPF